jgi:hypothetical protein
MKDQLRRFIVALCGVVSVVSIILGTTYTYTARSLFNANVFAGRVADGLSDPALASLAASELADEIIHLRPDLIAYRPLIVGSLERIASSAPFRAVVRRAIKQAHETVFSQTGENIALTVGDLSVVVRDALAVNPAIAAKVPHQALDALGATRSWTPGKTLTRVMRIANRMRTRAFVLLGLGMGTGMLGFAFARRKDTFMLRCGIGITATAGALGIAAQFGAPGVAAVVKPRLASDLVRALWPAFVTPLALRMWVLGGMGLTVIAGVTSTFRRVNLVALGASLWRVVAGRPQRVGLGLLRGALLAMLGALAVFNAGVVVQVGVVIAAGTLFFFGVQEIFSVTLDWLPRVEAAVEEVVGKKRSGVPRVVLAGVLGVAVIGAGAWWMTRQDAEPAVPATIGACNGHPELCARRLNEVAFATSHNSMGGGDVADWMFPNQDKGIPAQLEDGVRGFLIDVHYGVPVGGRIKTILDDEAAARAKYEAVMGKEAVDAAMRVRDRLVGKETGERDVYLAHGFCELGATKFVDALSGMREFLVMHPGEVVIIVIQDESVAPADVAACFERSGLVGLVYRGPVVKPWPTLREIIDEGQRVVVLAENRWEGVPWYHGAFEVCQETPYGFKTPEEFSNRPNRGGTGGSLLLMNHWIETTPTPLPSNAAIVNAYDFLLKRARACRRERSMMPNLVAVDFYRTGELMRVVDALNGVEPPPTGAAP